MYERGENPFCDRSMGRSSVFILVVEKESSCFIPLDKLDNLGKLLLS